MTTNRATRWLIVFAAALAVHTTHAQSPAAGRTAPDLWPTTAWTESSPEAQGVSSNDLADALEFARARQINIHSLTIVRNGVIILDACFYPFTRGMRHDVASVTKSVVSLLTGIAIGEGHLEGVEQPVGDVLRTTEARGPEPGKAQLRIGNLLAMQSGLNCGFTRGEPELTAMRKSHDWVAYALSLPMAAEPGRRFGYCSPNYHVMSAALSTTTKQSALEYARRRLFRPLGIQDVYWPADPMGVTYGWGDLQLRPRDMAKIGLLMLRRGQWGTRRIVSESWIDSSTSVHAAANENEDYGLGWWISRRLSTLFEANGRGGQRISVVPEKNIVVVMTGGGFEPGDVGAYLTKAVHAETALPEDAGGRARLAEALRSIATPPEPHVVVQPAMAKRVSRRVYTLEDNAIGIRSLAVEFSGSAQALLQLRLSDGTAFVQPLGLDGRYGMTIDQSGAASAGRGDWQPGGRLRIELNRLARINRFVFDIDFHGDDVAIVASEPTEFGTINLRGAARSKAR
jgi:CubicO group peptidase (beta-lactamase class C family)